MTRRRLELTRSQILAVRRSVQALDQRLPPGARSLRRAAWAGLQDSMPRAALTSIHARVEGTTPATWEAPSLVQLWGPRYSAYVVDARDRALFSLGRLPDTGTRRRVAEELAARLSSLLAGSPMSHEQAGPSLGEPPNRLRYAALTGTVLMRWDGARAPAIWMVPPPDVSPRVALLELARRYLHVFGPSTAAWILSRDESAFRSVPKAEAPARLLPSGDTYFLLQGADRALLVESADLRRQLWTSRVWPGALLVAGEVTGTWRRAQGTVTIETWRRLSRAERQAVATEVASLPLPGIPGPCQARWAD